MAMLPLLTGLASAVALPAGQLNSGLHHLFARVGIYDASCDRKTPATEKLFKNKISAALADAGTLAQTTQNGMDSQRNAFTESTAFSHYFGEGEKDRVKKMVQAIYNNRIPDDSNHGSEAYTITIKCGSDRSDKCGPSNLAVTNAKPGETIMVFCDRFFNATTAETKQDLSTKMLGMKQGQWCQKDKKLPFFEVAGFTVFHEMTHLHIVGQQAGLSARPNPNGFSSAGTVDVYNQGSEDDMAHYNRLEHWEAARELRRLWSVYEGDNSAYKPTTPAVENAESYAAAALEFYFLSMCSWDVILPS